jgi:hypothetical protein
MDVKYMVTVIGIVLVLVTTAVEISAWYRSHGKPEERRKAGWISVLNVVAAILLIAGQL